MLKLPLNFKNLDEIHIKNFQVVSLAEFSVHKPIYTLAIHVDQSTYETELKLYYRTQLPDALPDDPNVRPGGRELRRMEIAVSALGPNVDFHFSTIKELESFFFAIIEEAKKLAGGEGVIPPQN